MLTMMTGESLTIVTLENSVYMNMKNDVTFLLDNRLSLYEHQSTWNPNMPLRDLFYVSRTYQGLVKDERCILLRDCGFRLLIFWYFTMEQKRGKSEAF